MFNNNHVKENGNNHQILYSSISIDNTNPIDHFEHIPIFSAAIVESREHKDFEYVIEQFRNKLPDNCLINIFYGKGRDKYIQRITKNKKNIK